MPELPEVETIKIGLKEKIVGLKIVDVEILNPKSFQGDQKEVIGQKITGVWRRGKVLGIELGNDRQLLFHLKMTGQLILAQKENRATRIIFEFNEGSKLYFNDQRKFGWVRVVEKLLMDLGPEPLDEKFTWEVLKNQLLRRKKTPVKIALMDQKLIAGVGNIYASEALFLSKIHPKKKVSELSDEEFKSLHMGLVKSLELGIKLGGSSRSHYVNAEGKKGSFLDFAFCYERKGKPCLNCKAPIEKITLGGRGTYFCPNCQT